jgi:hypothetical protein
MSSPLKAARLSPSISATASLTHTSAFSKAAATKLPETTITEADVGAATTGWLPMSKQWYKLDKPTLW